MTLSALEAARNEQIARNKERLKALEDAAEQLKQVPTEQARKLSNTPRRPSGRTHSGTCERRKPSARNEGARVNYKEEAQDEFFGDESWCKRRRTHASSSVVPVYLDDEAAREARLQAGIGLDGEGDCPSDGAPRGIDSGKGVRIQNGVVYDSVHGVTCHWCRQKTLKANVTCTNPDCGGVRAKLPVTFCKTCLRNRNGEDWEAARASGRWVCPPCRRSCGPGCTICCNCGPCRKKNGMAPTGQVMKQVLTDGFANVHDWLVNLNTHEKPEVIAKRKYDAPWGAWLYKQPEEAEEEGAGPEDEETPPAGEAPPAADCEAAGVQSNKSEKAGEIGSGGQGSGAMAAERDTAQKLGGGERQDEGMPLKAHGRKRPAGTGEDSASEMDCDPHPLNGGTAANLDQAKAKVAGPGYLTAFDPLPSPAQVPVVNKPVRVQNGAPGKVGTSNAAGVNQEPLQDVSKRYSEPNHAVVQTAASGQTDTAVEALTDAEFGAFVAVFNQNQQAIVNRIEAAMTAAPADAADASTGAPTQDVQHAS